MERSQPTNRQTKQQAPESSMLFSSLAPELRIKIYESVWEDGEVIAKSYTRKRIVTYEKFREDEEVIAEQYPQACNRDLVSLSLVNRKTRCEARSMYFSINRLRIRYGPDTHDQSIRWDRLNPFFRKANWKHLTVMAFLCLATKEHRRSSDSIHCVDLGFWQRFNLEKLIMMITAGCKTLETLTIEVSKRYYFPPIAITPFEMHAPGGVLGEEALRFITRLRMLFRLPVFRELILVQKKDVKLDWFAGQLLEGNRQQWSGTVVIKQGCTDEECD